MKLEPLGNNRTLVTFDDGIEILFSYSTPVAAFVPGDGYVKTSTFHSKTTGRHINNYVNGWCSTRPQSYFDELGRRES